MLKMIQAKYRSSYWLPESRRNIKLTRVQELDETSTVGKELIKYYPDNCEVDGQPYIQTVGIELPGLQSSASEIDGSVNSKQSYIIGGTFYNIDTDKSFLNLDDFNITGTSSGTPIIENRSINLKFGTESLTLGNTTEDETSTYTDMNKNFEQIQDFTNVDFVTFWVYVNEEHHVKDGFVASDFGSCRILFTDTSGNYSGTRFCDSQLISLQSGWNNISIPKAKFTVNSSTVVDWSIITSMRIQFRVQTGNNSFPIEIDSVIAGGNSHDKTPIVITLDDGTTDTYHMAKIMNQYGIPVSSFVTPAYVDSTTAIGYLDLKHIQELYNNGNHIGIHGTGASSFASNPNQIIEARDWLKNNGFTRNDGHLYGTYPNGGYSKNTIDLCRANGIKGFRQVTGVRRQDIYSTQATKGGLPYECILNGGIADSLKVSGHRPLNYSEFVSRIDEAIEFKASYLPYHHLFSEVGGRDEWVKMAKYLKQKVDEGLIECLTFPQYINKYGK